MFFSLAGAPGSGADKIAKAVAAKFNGVLYIPESDPVSIHASSRFRRCVRDHMVSLCRKREATKAGFLPYCAVVLSGCVEKIPTGTDEGGLQLRKQTN